MLSAKTIEIVKQSVPILEEQGEALTRHFYQRMFSLDPQVRSFFNPAHQVAGTQQRALAAAICAYARHIEKPSALKSAVELIAHKHASLGVKAEHYPVVGKHLLASIGEVLGLAQEHETIQAWAQAYEVLAKVLMDKEAQIYDQHQQKHGFVGFRKFIVQGKHKESDIITSFYLTPADAHTLLTHLPGQYLTVRMDLPNGSTTMRNYSISNAPGAPHYRISVKRQLGAHHHEPKGYVSNRLHDEIDVGDVLDVAPPCGDFVLDTSQPSELPLVLISGGVGITPCLSMLYSALTTQPGRKIHFIHGALNQRVHAFGAEVEELAKKHANLQLCVRYSEPESGFVQNRFASEGFIDASVMERCVSSVDAEFYVCGPKPFMESMHRLLRDAGVSPSRVHCEFFGPNQTLESGAQTNAHRAA